MSNSYAGREPFADTLALMEAGRGPMSYLAKNAYGNYKALSAGWSEKIYAKLNCGLDGKERALIEKLDNGMASATKCGTYGCLGLMVADVITQYVFSNPSSDLAQYAGPFFENYGIEGGLLLTAAAEATILALAAMSPQYVDKAIGKITKGSVTNFPIGNKLLQTSVLWTVFKAHISNFDMSGVLG